jgi:hypothetical protein
VTTELTPPNELSSAAEQRLRTMGRLWAFSVAVGVMLLTLVPYLIGASFAQGRRFMWLGYNLDDACVYLSWMKQAADGSLRAMNLFTTAAQHGMALNPLFLVLGRIARWTGLPLLAVYHAARLLFGIGLLAVVWEFLLLTIPDNRTRRLSFLLVCFSSGLGWLPIWWDAPPLDTPIDKWQPEAITFLSLYLSPLFAFSMALQVGILTLLFLGERTGRMRYAVAAGLCGFLLGLTHSYDIISLAAIWLVYLLINTLRPFPDTEHAAPDMRGKPALSAVDLSATEGMKDGNLEPRNPNPDTRITMWLRAIVAGVLTAPAVLYLYHELRTEAVFSARANVQTLSPPLAWVLLGYGVTLFLALVGAYALLRHNKEVTTAPYTLHPTPNPLCPTPFAARLLVVWAVVNVAVSYLPKTPFQRKMLQGAHIPIAILAGIGVVWLLSRFLMTKTRPPDSLLQRLLPVCLVLFLSLTNGRFVLRDIGNYADNRAQTKLQRPFLQPGEMEALQWIAAHTPKDAALQPLPWVQAVSDRQFAPTDASVACFAPGLINRHVYCGHWGETPDFPAKLSELSRFAMPGTTDDARIALLRKMQVRYLLFSQKALSDESADLLMPMFRERAPLPPYLTRVYSNPDADVYAVSAIIHSSRP